MFKMHALSHARSHCIGSLFNVQRGKVRTFYLKEQTQCNVFVLKLEILLKNLTGIENLCVTLQANRKVY